MIGKGPWQSAINRTAYGRDPLAEESTSTLPNWKTEYSIPDTDTYLDEGFVEKTMGVVREEEEYYDGECHCPPEEPLGHSMR